METHTSKEKYLKSKGYNILEFETENVNRVGGRIITNYKNVKVAVKGSYIPDRFSNMTSRQIKSEIGVNFVYKQEKLKEND